MMKIFNRKIIFIIIIATLIGFGVWQGFFKKGKTEYLLYKVEKGNIIQEVSETGTIKVGEEINLSFKNSGRIEKIYVKVGDKVKSSQELAKLETNQLIIQLQEAEASLEVAQANFNKLLAGSSSEEIKIAQASVLNAEVSLENAKQNLKDTDVKAQEDLSNAYQDALPVLDSSYLEINNALNVANLIQRTYFTLNDQPGINVREGRDKIYRALKQAEAYINKIKKDSKNENIEETLLKVKEALKDTSEALEVIRNMIEEESYRDVVSSANKTSLDTQKSNINTAYTNVVDTQQTISSTKITNELDINIAKANVSTAEAQLIKAKDELALKKAGPRQEDIDLYQAKIRQAQAQVNLLKNQIQDTILKSPTEGQITKINKKVGEIIQITDSVISFISVSPLEIKANIYEEDVVKVKVDNPVDISLVAFPGQIFKGKVISINPAEKLIEGVVYYEVTIIFEEVIPGGIKPGMSVDVAIKTASQENVLVVPRKAIQKKNGKTIVEIKKGDTIEEREIEIGIEGSDGMVEMVSGLMGGEEVIIR